MGIDGSLGAAYEIAHGIEIRPGHRLSPIRLQIQLEPAQHHQLCPLPRRRCDYDRYLGVSIMAGFRF